MVLLILLRSLHSAMSSDVGCKTVANMIKGKTPEEIRKLFNIVNDFTSEEEVRGFPLVCPFFSDIPRTLGTNQEGERKFVLNF